MDDRIDPGDRLAPVILRSAVNGLGYLLTGCSDAARAALLEFPHYGGITAEPDESAEAGCYVDLPVGDPPEDVIACYREQLTEHGWTLDDSENQGSETSEGAFVAGESPLTGKTCSGNFSTKRRRDARSP